MSGGHSLLVDEDTGHGYIPPSADGSVVIEMKGKEGRGADLSGMGSGGADNRLEVPRDQKTAFIVYTVFLLGMVILYLILEYTVDDRGRGSFCGPGGMQWVHSSWFTSCQRNLILYVPAVLTLIVCFNLWLCRHRPWDIPPAHRFFSLERPRQMPPFFGLRLVLFGFAALLPISRILLRAIENVYSRPNTPGILTMGDVLEVVSILIVLLVTWWSYHIGQGVIFVVRLYFGVGAFVHAMAIGNVIEEIKNDEDRLDATDIFYAGSFIVYAILVVMMYWGWKDAAVEGVVVSWRRPPRQRGIPPMSEVWDLLKGDKWMVYIGLILSFAQGTGLNFALISSAALMGGDADSNERATRELVIFLAFSISVGVTTVLQQGIFGVVGQRVQQLMKDRMFRNFMLQDAQFLHAKENDTGALSSRLNTDTEKFGKAITVQLSAVMKPVAQILTGLIFMFALHVRLTTVMIVMCVLLMVVNVVRTLTITVKYSRIYSDELAKVSSRGVEVLKGIMAVHQFLQEKNEHIVFQQQLRRVFEVAKVKELLEALFEGLELLLISAIAGVGLWYGAILHNQDDLSEDDLISFALISAAVVAAVQEVMKIIPEFLDAAGPALRVCEYINKKVEWDFDVEDRHGRVMDKLQGKITFKNVQFAYPGASKKILGPNLNFTIQAGESVALVGESGCGKSTLISIVQRQYDMGGYERTRNRRANPQLEAFGPTKEKPFDMGEVYVDDVRLTDLNRQWYLEQVGTVAQSAVMFNTDIYNNVTYGRHEERFLDEYDQQAREDQRLRVIWALKQAAAWDEFINPDIKGGLGLDFQVGEDGCHLSGGQKQRISIARMIYKRPAFFIFDEVTSALDAASERRVMDTLIKLSHGKTCMMIAHRLNTIRHANNILVLNKKGQIEQYAHHNDGDSLTAHDKLVAVEGRYRRLYMDQSFDGEEGDAKDEKKGSTTGTLVESKEEQDAMFKQIIGSVSVAKNADLNADNGDANILDEVFDNQDDHDSADEGAPAN